MRSAGFTAFLLLGIAGLQACVDPGVYRCGSDASCATDGAEGRCEADDPSMPLSADNQGYCAFSDAACDSGRRFGEFADERAETCVACGGFAQPCCGAQRQCSAGLGCVGSVCGCVAEIAAGFAHTCARKVDGSVWCWGFDANGQAGVDLPDGVSFLEEPARVGSLTNTIQLALRYRHSCAAGSDGSAHCWGANDVGQLGDGTTTSSAEPVTVGSGALLGAAEVALTNTGTCGALVDGSVACWGDMCPVLGAPPQLTPAPLGGLPSRALRLTADATVACALLDDGAVWCWGPPEQCDPSTTTGSEGPPVRLPLRGHVAQLAGASGGGAAAPLGGLYVCALLTDGSLWCWGSDTSGVFGTLISPVGAFNAVIARVETAPVQVPNIEGPVEIAPGGRHICARWADGSLRCWGRNDEGQLGDGSNLTRVEPKPIALPARVDLSAAGDLHTCASSLGRIWCWGSNAFGQLGDGTTDDRLSPVLTRLSCP